MTVVAPDQLVSYGTAILTAAGAGTEEARTVMVSLVESNLRGHDSHGVMRLTEYVPQLLSGELVAGASLRTLAEGPAFLAAEGGYGFGQVQCGRMVDRLVALAKTSGVACGTLSQCGHVGRLGEWVERAAAQGAAAFLSVNDNGVEISVAPPGGTRQRISTNPLALAVPTVGEPLVLDISTSAVANGKLKVARLAGTSCPPGWIQDADGEPSTDPHVMLADPPGALLPLGGDQAYKGFGLALLLDILVSGLSGGYCPPAPPQTRYSNNALFMVWDPDRFAGRAHLQQEAERLITWVRETPRKAGVERIQIPGDGSQETRRRRLAEGIPFPGGNGDALAALGAQFGLPQPSFLK